MTNSRGIRGFLLRVESWLAWLLAVVGALLVGAAVWSLLVWQIRSFDGPRADLWFAVGVTVATSAAAADFWSRLYEDRFPQQSRSLGLGATVLTWVGLGITCYSTTLKGFERLPMALAVGFFALMTVLSLAGGWVFTRISSAAPAAPTTRPVDAGSS